MKRITFIFLLLLFPLSIITQNISGGEALVLKALNNKLATQVNPIVFKPYQTAVTNEILRNQLNKYFPIIKEVVNAVNSKLPGYVVQVTGYANPPGDGTTQKAKNTAKNISARRAYNVRAALIKKGLKAGVLTYRGLGGADRVTPSYNGDKDAWGKNRRVVLKVVKK